VYRSVVRQPEPLERPLAYYYIHTIPFAIFPRRHPPSQKAPKRAPRRAAHPAKSSKTSQFPPPRLATLRAMFRASRVSKRTGFERKARAWTTKRPNTEKQANTAAATQQRSIPAPDRALARVGPAARAGTRCLQALLRRLKVETPKGDFGGDCDVVMVRQPLPRWAGATTMADETTTTGSFSTVGLVLRRDVRAVR
jgi:hypothetical protein